MAELMLSECGETVFLTREEAKKALKEAHGNSNRTKGEEI